MITRENYESFFVDYLDGNLPENMIDQFLDFLNQNPDLKEELHLFEEVNLPEEPVVFSEKNQLYKTSEQEKAKLEANCIAFMEGDMLVDEQKLFEAYLAGHPELKKESDQFAKTRLIPEIGIRFQHKNKLYRKSGTTILFNWVARAAAVIVLAWGINSVIQMQHSTPEVITRQEIAKIEETPIEKATAIVAESKTEVQSIPRQNLSASPEATLPEKTEELAEEKTLPEQNQPAIEREKITLASITPISSRLEATDEVQLAFHQGAGVMPLNEPRVLSVDEFLAMRVEKAGKEGIFSAQRLARLGLNIASEISGERIGYKTKDGKITSVDFESKLMAFSIPLEKK